VPRAAVDCYTDDEEMEMKNEKSRQGEGSRHHQN